MIDVKELRTGNYVNSEYDGLTVVDIRLLERVINEIEDIYPFALNETWLEKLGFVKSHDNGLPYQISYKKDKLLLNSNFEFVVDVGNGNVIAISDRIEHVHRLQNLYFDLHLDELIIVNDPHLPR